MEILSKLKFNILFALAATLILVVVNGIFTEFSVLNSLQSEDFWVVLTLLFIGTLIIKRSAQFIYFGFLLFIILIELLHWSYYKNPILPAELYKFFTEYSEISQAMGTNVLGLFIVPLIIVVIVIGLFYVLITYASNKSLKVPFVWMIPFVAIGVLTYNASLERSVNRSQNLNQNLLRSGLECIGSFFGKYLPTKLSDKNYGGADKPMPKRIPQSNADIIIIIGESLSYQRMSLFGYSKKTTPKLDSLYKANQIFKKKCIPGATCTEVSVLSFFNQLDSVGQYNQVLQGNHFLFKLAKQNNYNTAFITSQSLSATSSFMGQMDKNYIDYFSAASVYNSQLSGTDFSLDTILLPQLKKVLAPTKNNFIVLQMYGSHEQYQQRYPAKYNKFNEKDYKFPQSAHYDNSVLYTDNNLYEMINYLRTNTTKPTYVFFISDHGECAGEEDVFGHNMFRNQVLSVPFIYQSFNNVSDTMCNYINKSPGMFTHHKLSLLIGRLLGYDYQVPKNPITFVNGMDIDGLDGFNYYQYNDSLISEVKINK